MSTAQEPSLSPVTQEDIGTNIWRLLEDGASKKMAADYMMNYMMNRNLSVPMFDLDGHPTSVPIDEPSANAFVGHIDALRKRHIRRGAAMRILAGAGGIVLTTGVSVGLVGVGDGVLQLDQSAVYILPAFIGGILGSAYLLITGFLRLLTTIGESASILIRSKNAAKKMALKLAANPMKLVNKLNGSEDL